MRPVSLLAATTRITAKPPARRRGLLTEALSGAWRARFRRGIALALRGSERFKPGSPSDRTAAMSLATTAALGNASMPVIGTPLARLGLPVPEDESALSMQSPAHWL